MFEIHSEFKPAGDQPKAIEALARGVLHGDREQTLMGVTGSGKTFTMANLIAKTNKPTLVLAHNKILAAQLCSEFKEFFPNSAVEYFDWISTSFLITSSLSSSIPVRSERISFA